MSSGAAGRGNNQSNRAAKQLGSTQVTGGLTADTLTVGPQGTPTNVWQSYTPTIGAVTTAPTLGTTTVRTARYQVIGKTMFLSMQINTSAAGTAGTGTYLFPLPAGYQFRTPDTSDRLVVGSGFVRADAVRMNCYVVAHLAVDATKSNLALLTDRTEADSLADTAISATAWDANSANGVTYAFTAVLEIA